MPVRLPNVDFSIASFVSVSFYVVENPNNENEDKLFKFEVCM